MAEGTQVGAYAQLLFQANLACEAYVIQRHAPENTIALAVLARELSLPERLFSDLDKLSVEV